MLSDAGAQLALFSLLALAALVALSRCAVDGLLGLQASRRGSEVTKADLAHPV